MSDQSTAWELRGRTMLNPDGPNLYATIQCDRPADLDEVRELLSNHGAIDSIPAASVHLGVGEGLVTLQASGSDRLITIPVSEQEKVGFAVQLADLFFALRVPLVAKEVAEPEPATPAVEA